MADPVPDTQTILDAVQEVQETVSALVEQLNKLTNTSFAITSKSPRALTPGNKQ